jgi:uncharacterized protein
VKDLVPGMMLEGVVTNVAAFGAFVDIGVHQDGLVHISALSNTFVKDPHEVVKAGQVVRVKVLEVDLPRKRIALTMRMSDEAAPKRERHDNAPSGNRNQQQRPRDNAPQRAPRQQAAPMNNAMAEALAKLRKSP